MMKFLAAFFTTITFLFGAVSITPPLRTISYDLVPSKIVDKKKIAPIKVPVSDCIVSVEGEAHTLEEHVEMCLTQRQWLDISIDEEKPTI